MEVNWNSSGAKAVENQPAADLADLRKRIDEVDRDLLRLLNRRAEYSLAVGRLKADGKSAVLRPLREGELLDNLSAINSGSLPDAHMRAIWREILSSSRALQKPQNIAYLGPEGTFSYFAGVEYLGNSATYHPCRDIAQIFEEVTGDYCDLGIVPLENSLQGTVGVSFDLFLKYDVKIVAELYSRISHCLLSTAKELGAIEKIYSHPQPLAQCGGWLRTHMPCAALIPVESTAAAARLAAAENNAAAIGNGRLAKMLGLEILARAIEDEQGNWTRFVIIAPARAGVEKLAPAASPDARPLHCKTSLLFTLPDKPGSLASVLELLAEGGVNMRKLESRPLKGQPWRYVFFADVESDLNNPAHAGLLDQLALACTSFRVLGSYPAGPQLDRIAPGNAPEEGV